MDEPTHDTSSSQTVELPSTTPLKKPVGEVGKDYKLLEVSRLDSDTYSVVEACLKDLTAIHLNLQLNFSQQDRTSLNTVLQKASTTFPCLESFENNWVTLDFIKMELRRTVAQSRKKKN